MSRGPQSFKQSDFTKALKAVEKAGLGVSRCEIDPRTGKIVIIIRPHDVKRWLEAARNAGSQNCEIVRSIRARMDLLGGAVN